MCLQKAGLIQIRMVGFSAHVRISAHWLCFVSAMVYSPRCQTSLASVGVQLNHRDLLRIGQEDGPVRHLWLEHLKELS